MATVYYNEDFPEFDDMIIGEPYYIDGSDYIMIRDESNGLHVYRETVHYLTAPEHSVIQSLVDWDYRSEVIKFDNKLHLGFTKDGKCCSPQDSLQNVAFVMAKAGINEFQVKSFDSMLDALGFISEKKLKTVAR